MWACKGTAELGLKFVAHFGLISEISVARFTKASGLDMIIAHRLLKNEIDGDDYVLFTDAYLAKFDGKIGSDLAWHPGSASYTDVGSLGIQYAMLDDVKAGIPPLPERESPVIPLGDDKATLEIEAPLLKVYANLIDIDQKPKWVVGLDGIDRKETTPRIDERHVCIFQGMAVNFELVHGSLGPNEAIYSERADFQGMPFSHQQTYTLTPTATGGTALEFAIAWGDEPTPPDEMKEMYMGGCSVSFEGFKKMCEA